jgi:hypothetical protein
LTGTNFQATFERRAHPGQYFGAGAMFPPHGSLAAFGEPGVVVVDRGEQLRYAGPGDGNRRQNWNDATMTRLPQVNRRTEESLRVFGPRLVRLIDGNDVANLQQA